MLWWDTRRLSEPTDSLMLCTDVKAQGQILGGSSLEYNSEAGPSKYLVGTEQGVVLMVSVVCFVLVLYVDVFSCCLADISIQT